jgi:hypothetical protein
MPIALSIESVDLTNTIPGHIIFHSSQRIRMHHGVPYRLQVSQMLRHDDFG